MSIIRVRRYIVEVYGFPHRNLRLTNKSLRLYPHQSYDGPVELASVWFIREPDPPPFNVYTVPMTNSNGLILYAHLPEEDFDPMYHLLQSEEPVYFDWQDEDYFRLMTAEEPPGEGYDDIPSFIQ